jgi:hypothetical protein
MLCEVTEERAFRRKAEVGISVGSVLSIRHKDFNMHYFSKILVPRMPAPEREETRVSLAGDVITMADRDADLSSHSSTFSSSRD